MIIGMDDLIDTRNFRKGAVTILKNGSSLDKDLRRTFPAGMKSVNTLSVPIFSDSASHSHTGDNATVGSATALSLSTDVNGMHASLSQESIAKKETNTSRIPSTYIRRGRQDQIRIFAEKCWDVFQSHAINPSNVPLDIREYEFPSKHLNSALHYLSNFALTPSQENNSVEVIVDDKNNLLPWKTFKNLMFSTYNIPFGPYDPKLEVTRSASSYAHLLQKQRIASSVPPNEVATALEVEQAAAAVKLQGKIVPMRFLKDAFVSVVTEDYHSSSKLQSTGESDGQADKNEASSYSDSIKSDPDNLPNASGSTMRNPLGEAFSAPLQKMTVGELANSSQQYSLKWLHMKKLRDERTRREISKRMRSDMLNAFARIVLIADK